MPLGVILGMLGFVVAIVSGQLWAVIATGFEVVVIGLLTIAYEHNINLLRRGEQRQGALTTAPMEN